MIEAEMVTSEQLREKASFQESEDVMADFKPFPGKLFPVVI